MLEPAVCRGGRGWWHSSRGPGGVLCVAAVGQLTGVDHRLGGVPQLSPCGSFDDVKGWWRRHRARAVGRAHGRGGGTHRRGSPWGCRWSAIGVGPEGRTCDGATAFQAWRTAVDRPVVAGWTLWEPNTPFASYPALGQIEQICPSGSLAYHGESRGIGEPYPRAARVPFTASTRLTADAGDSGRGLASTTAYLYRPPPSSLLRRARTPWHTRGEITSRATCGGAGPFSHAGRATPTDALAKISHKPDGLITRERVCLEGPGTRFALSRRAVCPRRNRPARFACAGSVGLPAYCRRGIMRLRIPSRAATAAARAPSAGR